MTPALMLPLALIVPFVGRPLWVPREASILSERVHAACPDCDNVAFAPCGDPKIGYGRRFFSHFFAGQPESGYLVGSAGVTVVFRDPLGSGRSLEYRYAPLGGGRSLLYERAAGGRRTGVRFCLDQPGELAVDW